MKKLVFALTLIIGSIGYVFEQRGMTQQAIANTTPIDTPPAVLDTPIQTAPVVQPTQPATPTKNPPRQPKPTPRPTPVPVATGGYKDGTYNGTVVDAFYGNIQVAALISGGKLSNVKILQSPNDRSTSIEINQEALPILVQEAIRTQSANVDGVSGASESSPAFNTSLASALAKAKA